MLPLTDISSQNSYDPLPSFQVNLFFDLIQRLPYHHREEALIGQILKECQYFNQAWETDRLYAWLAKIPYESAKGKKELLTLSRLARIANILKASKDIDPPISWIQRLALELNHFSGEEAAQIISKLLVKLSGKERQEISYQKLLVLFRYARLCQPHRHEFSDPYALYHALPDFTADSTLEFFLGLMAIVPDRLVVAQFEDFLELFKFTIPLDPQSITDSIKWASASQIEAVLPKDRKVVLDQLAQCRPQTFEGLFHIIKLGKVFEAYGRKEKKPHSIYSTLTNYLDPAALNLLVPVFAQFPFPLSLQDMERLSEIIHRQPKLKTRCANFSRNSTDSRKLLIELVMLYQRSLGFVEPAKAPILEWQTDQDFNLYLHLVGLLSLNGANQCIQGLQELSTIFSLEMLQDFEASSFIFFNDPDAPTQLRTFALVYQKEEIERTPLSVRRLIPEYFMVLRLLVKNPSGLSRSWLDCSEEDLQRLCQKIKHLPEEVCEALSRLPPLWQQQLDLDSLDKITAYLLSNKILLSQAQNIAHSRSSESYRLATHFKLVGLVAEVPHELEKIQNICDRLSFNNNHAFQVMELLPAEYVLEAMIPLEALSNKIQNRDILIQCLLRLTPQALALFCKQGVKITHALNNLTKLLGQDLKLAVVFTYLCTYGLNNANMLELVKILEGITSPHQLNTMIAVPYLLSLSEETTDPLPLYQTLARLDFKNFNQHLVDRLLTSIYLMPHEKRLTILEEGRSKEVSLLNMMDTWFVFLAPTTPGTHHPSNMESIQELMNLLMQHEQNLVYTQTLVTWILNNPFLHTQEGETLLLMARILREEIDTVPQKRPHHLYQELKAIIQTESLAPIALKPFPLGHLSGLYSVNLDTLREMCQQFTISIADTNPASALVLVQSMWSTAEERLSKLDDNARQNINALIKETCEFPFEHLKTSMMNAISLIQKILSDAIKADGKVEPYVYALVKSLEWISQGKDSGDLLTEKEERLFYFCSNLLQCKVGQRNWSLHFYRELQETCQLTSEKKFSQYGKVKEFLFDVIQKLMLKTFSNEFFLKDIGIPSSLQKLHIVLYLENRWHQQLGYSHAIVFDRNTKGLPDILLQLKVDEVVSSFFNHCSPSAILESTKEAISKQLDAQISGSKTIFATLTYSDLLEFWSSHLPAREMADEEWMTRYLTFDEKMHPIALTDLGAVSLLVYAKLLCNS